MMTWYDGASDLGGWALMGLMVLFWLAILATALWAGLHFLRAEGSRPVASPSPRAVLDSRLASGEIDVEHYARLRRVLDGDSAAAASSDHVAP